LAEQLMVRIKEHKKLIVFIGDTMSDHWIHGHVAECQDGCPKFVKEAMVSTPGGAANAYRSIVEWKVRSSLYGFNMGRGPIKARYVDKSGNILFRVDDEQPCGQNDSYNRGARERAIEAACWADAVLLSDYDKGFLTPKLIQKVAKICKERGVPCVADCKREPSMYAGCILKANGAWGVSNLTSGSANLCGSLKGVWGTQYVETHGADCPSVWDNKDWVHTTIPNLPPITCINHVGAGDCFAAHLTLALAYGFTLVDAATLAHSAGRVYVQRPHNHPPCPEEIAANLINFGG
jgi:bifunctional ADP-heptose synthase (sugar kinase/adenylyltransferase)